MATLDKVKITLPDGTVFEATDNIRVREIQEPFWMVDGFQRLRTLGEKVGFIDNDTSQVKIGSGTRARYWQIEFTQFEGSTDTWGSTADGDDVLVKLNAFGQALATSGVDSTNTATLEYGEYTSTGAHSAQDVVPGEINLPAEFGPGESATTFQPSMQWIDAADVNQVLHSAP